MTSGIGSAATDGAEDLTQRNGHLRPAPERLCHARRMLLTTKRAMRDT